MRHCILAMCAITRPLSLIHVLLQNAAPEPVSALQAELVSADAPHSAVIDKVGALVHAADVLMH